MLFSRPEPRWSEESFKRARSISTLTVAFSVSLLVLLCGWEPKPRTVRSCRWELTVLRTVGVDKDEVLKDKTPPPRDSTGKFCKTQRVPVTSKALSTHFVGSNTVSESLVWGWYTQAILPFSIFLLWTLLCFDCEMSPIGSYVWTLGGQLKVLLEKVITSLGDQI